MVQGSADEVIQNLSKAIELNPNEPQYYWERGFMYFSNGLIKKFEADMTKILEIANPESDGEILLKAGTLLNSYKGNLEDNP